MRERERWHDHHGHRLNAGKPSLRYIYNSNVCWCNTDPAQTWPYHGKHHLDQRTEAKTEVAALAARGDHREVLMASMAEEKAEAKRKEEWTRKKRTPCETMVSLRFSTSNKWWRRTHMYIGMIRIYVHNITNSHLVRMQQSVISSTDHMDSLKTYLPFVGLHQFCLLHSPKVTLVHSSIALSR